MQQGQHGGSPLAGATAMLDHSRITLLVLVMMVRLVTGQQQQQQQEQQQYQGPLSCWTCSAYIHGNDCYDLDLDNKTLSHTCSSEEEVCMVNRIWYVVEGNLTVRNFSVNRTCSSGCSPSCVVIGDRTKIHSCTSCCTTPFCNIGSSASAQPMASMPLVTGLVAVLVVGVWLRPALPVALFLQSINQSKGAYAGGHVASPTFLPAG